MNEWKCVKCNLKVNTTKSKILVFERNLNIMYDRDVIGV